MSHGGNKEIAVAENIGHFPGLAPHGNSKNKSEYVRTPHHVMVEMGEMLKTKKPQHVYDKLTQSMMNCSDPPISSGSITKIIEIRLRKEKILGKCTTEVTLLTI